MAPEHAGTLHDVSPGERTGGDTSSSQGVLLSRASRRGTSRRLRDRLVWMSRVGTTRATSDSATSMEGHSSADALGLAQVGQLEPETAAAVLDNLVARLDHCLHELPAGVLFDTSDASSAQLRDLPDGVDVCRKLAEAHGLVHSYGPALTRAAFFFRTYQDCLDGKIRPRR